MATAISNNNANKNWNYLSFGLTAILAPGSTVSFLPQASAHITTNVQHMLEHIYAFVDGIEAKTNNLPADPASNTVVNTRASQTPVNTLQGTANQIKAKTDTMSAFTQIKSNSIYSEDLDIPNTYPEKVSCTSDASFVVLVNAASNMIGGYVQVTFNPVIDGVPSYKFPVDNNALSLTFAANAGESITVEAFGAGSDDGTVGIVTMQTLQGATASCTPTF